MDEIRTQDIVNLEDTDADELKRFLAEQNISLKPNELVRIRELFGRDPTHVELHIFNIMWSEHCSYKSSRAVLKKYLPTTGPNVVLGPGEDAGVVRFCTWNGKDYCLVMAHESHNHPSQVLPVEGAATGIGGIVRDVYCMGADVIGVMDPLRFGDPEGRHTKRVRDIVRGVVDGIAQYGNALGVPNYGGDTYFDASYDDNCLVNVVALGIVAEEDVIRSRAPDAARSERYDIILVGKPTDASGFGGAAFASERLSGDEEKERQEAVQVPDPFLKRVLTEATKVVLAEAKTRGVSIGFKDLGAGGISCAVSEMAHAGGVGAELDLDCVVKSPDTLPPEIIACSETQERYALFVPSDFTPVVLKTYNDDFELPHIYSGAGAYVIGRVTRDMRFRLRHRSHLVCDAHVDVITTGIEYERESRARQPNLGASEKTPPVKPTVRKALLELLSSVNIADKSILFQHYDSEVQGRAVLRPGEADAAVAVFLPGHPVGIAAGIGGSSQVAAVDPYLGGLWAVCEAVRNVACVGGRVLAVTDCLNYGDPEQPEVFWEFSEGVRGIGDACRGLEISKSGKHGIPVISGNVSFYNQSEKGQPIAPTPIVAAAGRVDDVSICQNLGFKKPGSKLVLLGEFHDSMGGSEYARLFLGGVAQRPPVPDLKRESSIIRTLVAGLESRVILAAHDISHGGMLVTLAEMMLGSKPFGTGCTIDLKNTPMGEASRERALFTEFGGIVVEIDAKGWADFQTTLDQNNTPWHALGETTGDCSLSVRWNGGELDVSVEDLDTAYRSAGELNRLFA
ncbi:MAG: phosphoribosylformylglycinamidine synthase subunit PurL [Candidatus Latescibacterota bacterium]|nr:MAG: phosphoribosylformylglycinamidine synthase subunit PurL [Candidatus Latescibacterota bacterium]